MRKYRAVRIATAAVSRIAGRFTNHVIEISVFAGIIVLALVLRLFQIGTENLWTDEWISLGDSRHIAEHNRHRPLFYLVLRVWLHFGRGDVWARLLGLLFGLGAIALLYVLGRRLVGVAAALVACAIMAIAVPELNHSQEVRMYTMASTLTLASLYALVVWVEERSRQPFRRLKPPATEVPGPGYNREHGDAEFGCRAQPAVTQDRVFEKDPAGERKTADADSLPRNVNFLGTLGLRCRSVV